MQFHAQRKRDVRSRTDGFQAVILTWRNRFNIKRPEEEGLQKINLHVVILY